ncbi:hypothetical protein QCA50_009698 [Cerrena zonata]|uniref:Uncharacterized protein n=1 Tax=Cerrena zonata TaxID=2478898 RepID=A0AAW0G673_9APHY
MFPASECSTPSRKPSRFGGKDIKPQTLIDTHYRVPLHPSAEFQVNRNSLSDYDFYLVPASQNRNSSLTDRVSSHSNSHTGINYGDPKHHLPDGSISSTNYCQPSVCLPRPDHQQVIQALQQTHSCKVNATRRDRHPTHEFYNTFIGETDALRDLAPSDYNSDGTSVAGPEDQCIDDCSFLSDDEPPVAPFITGSELEHDSADNPSEKSSLISRTRTSRCAGRLPMTTTLGEDNLEASRHCQTIVEDDINKVSETEFLFTPSGKFLTVPG